MNSRKNRERDKEYKEDIKALREALGEHFEERNSGINTLIVSSLSQCFLLVQHFIVTVESLEKGTTHTLSSCHKYKYLTK